PARRAARGRPTGMATTPSGRPVRTVRPFPQPVRRPLGSRLARPGTSAWTRKARRRACGHTDLARRSRRADARIRNDQLDRGAQRWVLEAEPRLDLSDAAAAQ